MITHVEHGHMHLQSRELALRRLDMMRLTAEEMILLVKVIRPEIRREASRQVMQECLKVARDRLAASIDREILKGYKR